MKTKNVSQSFPGNSKFHAIVIFHAILCCIVYGQLDTDHFFSTRLNIYAQCERLCVVSIDCSGAHYNYNTRTCYLYTQEMLNTATTTPQGPVVYSTSSKPSVCASVQCRSGEMCVMAGEGFLCLPDATSATAATGTPGGTNAPAATGTPGETNAPSATGTPGETNAPAATGTPGETTATAATGTQGGPTATAATGTPGGTNAPAATGTPGETDAPAATGISGETTAPAATGTQGGTTAPAATGTTEGTTAPAATGTPGGTTAPAATGTTSGTTAPAATGTTEGTTAPAATGTTGGTTAPAATETPGETTAPAATGTTGGTTSLQVSECARLTKNKFYYNGTVSITRTGLQCQRWNSQSPHRHKFLWDSQSGTGELLSEISNYCRVMNNVQAKMPWCFTISEKTRWQFCEIEVCPSDDLPPIDDCYEAREKDGEDHIFYNGTRNTTVSGWTCQRWDEQHPHGHDWGNDIGDFMTGERELGEVANYCRVTNGDDGELLPWCFTTNPDVRWEVCVLGACPQS